MRSINYHIAISIDGYISHEDGGIDGFLMEGEHAEEFVQSMKQYDTVLMGRKTYEFGFQYGLEPGQPAYPNLKHYIFSESLGFDSSENVRLIKSNILETINDIRSENGKEIWLCGGGELAGFLLNHDMIDKVTLKINPVVFGSGRKLFRRANKSVNLNLRNNKFYENGVQLVTYEVARNT